MKKILICGDSFSADYQKKDTGLIGWVNMLAQDHTVLNLSDAGCSEYRILKNIENSILSNFDAVIVCHTSPYRVYIKDHPIYKNDPLHRNSDLIYADIEYHLLKNKNKTLRTGKEYFETIFEDEYYKDMYFLMQDKIINLTKNIPCLHLTPLFDEKLYRFEHCINLSKLFTITPNAANHYSFEDNQQIYTIIKSWIDKNV